MVDDLTVISSGPTPEPIFRKMASWITASGCALLLNAALFGLMPGLVNRTPEKPVASEMVPMVNIVRLDPETPPVLPKPTVPPPPRKTPEISRRVEKPIHRTKVIPRHLQLPFKIDPSLPSGPGTVPVLPMATIQVDAPELKPSYEMGEIDEGLTPLAKAPPLYPMRARRRGIEGWVGVQFMVDEQGRVEDIKITASEPKTIFDQSVRQCVSNWRFTPGKVAGVPVKTRVETTIRFELK